jgi:transcriptional regulator with XRE-family HTH domain
MARREALSPHPRRQALSPQGEALVAALRREKEQGFSGRAIAERFGLRSESTVRDYLSGGRQPSAAAARAALEKYAEAVGRLRDIPTQEHGAIQAEPVDRKGWSTLGKYDAALKEAREKGDWSIVERRMGKAPKIRTEAGTVTLPTDAATLRESDDSGAYTGKDQNYRSPKKSKGGRRSTRRRSSAQPRRRTERRRA